MDLEPAGPATLKDPIIDYVEPSEADKNPDMFNCNWHINTEENMYLLVTFYNLSAPYTIECKGAYIEVERERNGFKARWCGNKMTTVIRYLTNYHAELTLLALVISGRK